jgi:rhodanese-related sulfurtransferase
MIKTVAQMMAEANAAVDRVSIADARQMIDAGALVIDVRDAPELEKTGKIKGALHVSRGMLEFRADPATPYHAPAFQKDRPILVYCASGGRSALSGEVLKDMVCTQVRNLGGFKDWADAGGEVKTIVDKGM